MVAIVICCLLNIQIIHVGVFFLPRAVDWMFMSHSTPTKVMCWEVIRVNVVTRVQPLWGDCVCVYSFSCVQIFVTPWTAAFQAPLSMGFSRQEYGVGSLSFLQGIFPIQGLSPHLLHWQADSLPLSHQRSHDGISALKSRGRDLRSLSLPPSPLSAL